MFFALELPAEWKRLPVSKPASPPCIRETNDMRGTLRVLLKKLFVHPHDDESISTSRDRRIEYTFFRIYDREFAQQRKPIVVSEDSVSEPTHDIGCHE